MENAQPQRKDVCFEVVFLLGFFAFEEIGEVERIQENGDSVVQSMEVVGEGVRRAVEPFADLHSVLIQIGLQEDQVGVDFPMFDAFFLQKRKYLNAIIDYAENLDGGKVLVFLSPSDGLLHQVVPEVLIPGLHLEGDGTETLVLLKGEVDQLDEVRMSQFLPLIETLDSGVLFRLLVGLALDDEELLLNRPELLLFKGELPQVEIFLAFHYYS